MTNMAGNDLVSRIVGLEGDLSAHVKELGKIKRALHTAAMQLRKNPRSSKTIEKLIAALAAIPKDPTHTDLARLVDELGAVLESIASGAGKNFRDELVAKAREQGVACSATADLMTIGPFELIIDQKKESAGLYYAKAPLEASLPIDVDKLLVAAGKLASELLDAPVDLSKLAVELEEAIMVSLARKRTSTRTAELRAELPAVHRELTFIRQGNKREVSKRGFREYPLARFVVELASLIRSDENISADKSFRLETAVIENTGNRRRSVFVPKNLLEGYGEGMFYQAVILRRPA